MTELDKNCPKCKDPITDHRSGCETCEQFQCAACKHWVPWDLGGHDDDEGRPLCDLCWSANDDDEDDTADEGALDDDELDDGPEV